MHRQMPEHTGHLADKNFLIRMLFKDSYFVIICVLSYFIKAMIDWLIDGIGRAYICVTAMQVTE